MIFYPKLIASSILVKPTDESTQCVETNIQAGLPGSFVKGKTFGLVLAGI